MPRLLLVRHAQSAWNAADRWQGWADVALSEEGERQAAGAALHLRDFGITGVASSDLQRAVRTASVIAEVLGLGPVTLEPRLREYDVGDWQGLTRGEIEARWPGELAAWREGRLAAAPGGEERAAFVARAAAAVEHLAATSEGPARVLVVTHGGVVRALQQALGAPDPERVLNLGGRWVDASTDGLRLGGKEELLDPAEATLSPSR